MDQNRILASPRRTAPARRRPAQPFLPAPRNTDLNAVTLIANPDLLSEVAYAGLWVCPTGIGCEPPPTITQSGGRWVITLDCDRRGDRVIAQRFRSRVGGAVHLFCPSRASGDHPATLYFYVGLTLTPTSGPPTSVYLGYGRQSGVLEWWWGSPALANLAGNAPAMLLGGRLMALRGTASGFALAAID